jgi:aryl-alcohol dehydrogenase-like predicted oxidoreductase
LNKFTLNIAGLDKNVSLMGLGAWQIGDRLFWDYGKTHQYQDSFDAFTVSVSQGINFIDTAEVYGFGRSEKILGEVLSKNDKPMIVATKYFPYPWRLSKNSVVNALKRSLQRLRLDTVDLYQIHWPFLSFRMSSWVEGLTEIVQMGLSHGIGVSNFNLNQTKKMFSLLREKNIPLISNQVEYNLLNRKIERNGLLDLCKELGITLIAYSPIAQGLLTGKYSHQNPLSGIRRYRYRSIDLIKLQALIDIMQEIGLNHKYRSPAQVAVNWLMCKGVLPIVGAKTRQQALENAGALGWRLSDQDINTLDDASDQVLSEN